MLSARRFHLLAQPLNGQKTLPVLLMSTSTSCLIVPSVSRAVETVSANNR